MNENKYLLNTTEAIFLILIVLINKLLLNLPSTIVTTTSSGTLINLLFIGLIVFFVLNLFIKLLDNFPPSDILDISYFLGGKILNTLISIIYILLLFFASSITLIEVVNILQIIYFKDFSNIYILLFFIVGALITNLLGFKSIVRCINFIVPLTIISIIISLLGVSNNFDITNFVPILGQNLETTFIKGLSNIFSMYIMIYFLFLKPMLKEPKDYKKITLISFFSAFSILVITIIPILNLYANTNNSESINYLYLLARNIKLGAFLKRVDAIFILLWIFCTLSYTSLSIYMINQILGKLLKVQSKENLNFFTIGILLILTLIPFNIAKLTFLKTTIYKYLIIVLGFILPLILLLLANLKKYKNSKI